MGDKRPKIDHIEEGHAKEGSCCGKVIMLWEYRVEARIMSRKGHVVENHVQV